MIVFFMSPLDLLGILDDFLHDVVHLDGLADIEVSLLLVLVNVEAELLTKALGQVLPRLGRHFRLRRDSVSGLRGWRLAARRPRTRPRER